VSSTVLYALRHSETGLVKVGRTCNFRLRYSQHCREFRSELEIVHVSECASTALRPDDASKERERWLLFRLRHWRVKAGRRRLEWCDLPTNVLAVLPQIMDDAAQSSSENSAYWFPAMQVLRGGGCLSM